MTMLENAVIEAYKDFPIFKNTVRGKRLIYLDSAATSQKPVQVIEAIKEFYEGYNSNIHRGAYYISEKATAKYEESRAKVQRFINAKESAEIIFTRGTTEAINLVANGWGRKFLRPGDEVLLSEMDHHSNIVPWQIITKATGAKLRYIPITQDGKLANVEKYITAKTRMLSITHVSNVLGTINPVKELAKIIHKNGGLVAIDGAQAAPHIRIDVQDLDVDFYAFSAHKIYGPTGLGVLYGKKIHLAVMDPFLGGGHMISQVNPDYSTWNELPYKFEAGTMPIAEVIALRAALDYLEGLGFDRVRAYEEELTKYLLEKLLSLKGITIYGPANFKERTSLAAFNYSNIHPHDIATAVDQEGIAIRAGHHCCQPLMRKLEVAATARASLGIYNRKEDVDALVEALRKAGQFFNGK